MIPTIVIRDILLHTVLQAHMRILLCIQVLQGKWFQSIWTSVHPSNSGVKVDYAQFTEIHRNSDPFLPHDSQIIYILIPESNLEWKDMAIYIALKGIVRGGAYLVVLKRAQVCRGNHGQHFATSCPFKWDALAITSLCPEGTRRHPLNSTRPTEVGINEVLHHLNQTCIACAIKSNTHLFSRSS